MAEYCVQSDKVLIYTKCGEYFVWLRDLTITRGDPQYPNLQCQFINVAGKQYIILLE